KGNINLPLVIIGLVLIVAVVGGLGAYNLLKTSQAKPPINGKPSPVATKPAPTPVISNVLGAQPPNLLGSPNALVTVEEFADFQCPTCGATHPKMKEIISTYGSRIKFIFRNFPLQIPAHDKAYEAAVAAEAAGLQGKFWDMQNLLFTNQQVWTANPDYHKVWEDYAGKIGLDVERFKNDMAGLNAKARVDADLARGRALNVSSTPSIYINGVLIPFEQMNVESMRQIIDGELEKAQKSNQTAPSAPTNSAPAEPKK
ncbi:MAG: thioredoxin domain-containing protein, partial [Actinomycetota bacterium]